MKKLVAIKIVLIVILVGVLVYMKAYYPALPIDSVSKHEAINKANTSNDNIVKLAEEDGYEWYISKMQQGAAYEQLKQMMIENGWVFKEQMGSGLIFQKENKELIIGSEMWTGKYVIFQLPMSE